MESEKIPAESQLLIDRLVTNDETAADEVFRRYVRRLTALARARLAPQVGRRADPEDAVQSAFRSFFVGARSGRFTLEHSGDLWRLLATITARKVARLTTRHRGAKRSVLREVRNDRDASDDLDFLLDQGPLPDQATALADELTEVMRTLPADQRRALQLRLEDVSVGDIAREVGCTDRTVRRWMNDWQRQLERRLVDASDAASPPPIRNSSRRVDERPTPPRPAAIEKPASIGTLPTIDYRDLVLESHLGTGGMGRVYRAWQRTADRRVAVKVLKKSRQHDRAAVDRFRTEAELIASLDHPGVVRLLGVGRMPAGGYFFTMPLVEGGDVQQRLDAGPIEPSHAVAWVRQAAAAVAHAYSRGVIHCDLKPSNLLLDRDDKVVVSDFGFAVALAGTTQPLGGTRAFIAPELLAGRNVSERTDVWGLGAVLYALLTGHPPWSADQTLVPLPDGVSPYLADVCRRCLTIEPTERYASVKELMETLDHKLLSSFS